MGMRLLWAALSEGDHAAGRGGVGVPRIFISYRRSDASPYAGRLYDDLCRQFGPNQVFIDVDTIEPGVDFVDRVEGAVGNCDVLIAVIGKRWLTSTDTRRRRKPDARDWVQLEIATALERNVRVIPVLVQGASIPEEPELPEALRGLARRQAVELNDVRWRSDVARLIDKLDGESARAGEHRVVAPRRRIGRRVWALGGLSIAAMVLLAGAGILFAAARPTATPAAADTAHSRVLRGLVASYYNALNTAITSGQGFDEPYGYLSREAQQKISPEGFANLFTNYVSVTVKDIDIEKDESDKAQLTAHTIVLRKDGGATSTLCTAVQWTLALGDTGWKRTQYASSYDAEPCDRGR
jgi:TIR domain